MSTSLIQSASPDRSVATPQTSDEKREWFAYALPALMAFLLVLVPFLNTAARIPFLLLFFPLVAVFALTDTERGIYVYIAWCWMDATIRGVFGGGDIMTLARDIVLALLIVGWAIRRLGTFTADRWQTPPGTLLVVLFIANALMQTLNPYSLGLMQNLGGLKIHLSPIPLFFISYDVFRRRGQIRSLFIFLTLATFVICMVSIVQYVHGPAWTYAHFPGSRDAISLNFNPSEGSRLTKDDIFKPPGTTGFGGGTAAYAGFVFPLVFALVLLSGRMRFNIVQRALMMTILFGFIVTFFVNSLRSSLVEAAACVLACSFFVGGGIRTKALITVGLCFVLGMIGYAYSQNITHGASSDRFSTLLADPNKTLHQDRKTFFEQVGEEAVNAPLGVGLGRTGAGAGHFGRATDRLGFDTFSEAYLGNMILETGIPGALLISGIAISFIVRGLQVLRRLQENDDKLLAAALFSILFIIFVNFFYVSVLVQPPGSILFWLFGAALLRVYEKPVVTEQNLVKVK